MIVLTFFSRPIPKIALGVVLCSVIVQVDGSALRAAVNKPNNLTLALDACSNVTGGGYEVMECLNNELARQDKELNRRYKIVMGGLSPQKKITLRGLQRNWIKDRDRRCEAIAANDSYGAGGTQTYTQCMITETKKRTVWLEKYK